MRLVLPGTLLVVLLSLAVPLPAADQLFVPDDEGMVAVNVVYREMPGDEEVARLLENGARLVHRFHLIPVVSLRVPFHLLDAAIERLAGERGVVTFEPDPADQRASIQTVPWGVSRVEAPSVHSGGNTAAGVNVAVMDSGVDYNHRDLAANYQGGYDFVNDDADPMDDSGHGTHVAGVLAAVDNTLDVIGVAPDVDLFAVKTLDSLGFGTHTGFARGLEWCVDHGIKVVNYSAGGEAGSTTLRLACQAAFDAGVIVVAAAGNDYRNDDIDYPAAYDTVLAVGSIGETDVRSSFSDGGPELDLVAPGENVWSTIIFDGIGARDGTSQAAPHVAGAAALVVKAGLRKPAAVFKRLRATAEDLGPAGRDDGYGYGLVNAAAAVPAGEFLVRPDGGETVAAGSIYTVRWDVPPGAERFTLKYSTDGGGTWTRIARDVLGDRYDWLVPVPRRNRRQSLVRVVAFDAADSVAGKDVSDSGFTVEVVRLVSPNGGETLAGGADQLVSWVVNETRQPVDLVQLFLTRNGGQSWSVVADLPGGTESHLWAVPLVLRPREACRLKVVLRSADGKSVGKDLSDGYFSIVPSP